MNTHILLCMHACKVASVMSDSLQPHGLEPARHFCPWDSPGKNTGVIPLSRGSSPPRDQTGSYTLQADSLPSEPPGNFLLLIHNKKYKSSSLNQHTSTISVSMRQESKQALTGWQSRSQPECSHLELGALFQVDILLGNLSSLHL